MVTTNKLSSVDAADLAALKSIKMPKKQATDVARALKPAPKEAKGTKAAFVGTDTGNKSNHLIAKSTGVRAGLVGRSRAAPADKLSKPSKPQSPAQGVAKVIERASKEVAFQVLAQALRTAKNNTKTNFSTQEKYDTVNT